MATYEIILKNETDNASENPVAGQETKTTNPEQVTAAKGLVSFSAVKPYINQVIQHQINTVELRTGSSELQQRISFAYQAAGTLVSIGQSAATGFVVGGGLPGAVIGALLGIAGKALSISLNQNTIDLQRQQESLSLGLMNLRAGGSVSSYSKSREGNQ